MLGGNHQQVARINDTYRLNSREETISGEKKKIQYAHVYYGENADDTRMAPPMMVPL